ncbi:MAG: FAD-binding oxidoreductase [Ancalomicrobiaceae bacterium]|nr:FAD-binding oxidoreductase [Ancalomicrobiaceae bacterium]
MRTDVIVLGAGAVGVSAAVHLRQKGREVVLLDRRGAGEETSFGNAGIIERDPFVPVAFPRALGDLVRYGLNLSPAAHYHLTHMPKIASWLWALRRNTDTAGIERYAGHIAALTERANAEHEAMIVAAKAERFLKTDGWFRFYRTEKGFREADQLHDLARRHGSSFRVISAAEFREIEPNVLEVPHKAVHWTGSWTISSPGGLVAAYADLFQSLGGRFLTGDARSLRKTATGWSVTTSEGDIEAADVVVALGPWSADLLRPFGLNVPLASKRGYHLHFGPKDGATLNHTVVDVENGYLIAPMDAGIRLTTGIEFADRDAAPTPVQIDRLKPVARKLFPLAEERDEAPWMGSRPALPDSLPIVGPAPGLKGLWLNLGHGHLGLTLGPVTGRLIAELITGQPPTVDVAPYRAERFL